MHETKAKVEKLRAMSKTLMNTMECELSKPVEAICTEESGEVIDMIKDLAEAEEKCWKACYYHKIVEAMDEEKGLMKKICEMQALNVMPMHEMDGRMGYVSPNPDTPFDPWYMRPWRNPYPPMDPPYLDRMGYTGDPMRKEKMMDGERPPAGQTMRERYQAARRYFTTSGNPDDKAEMDREAKACLEESLSTMRDIWVDADPKLQEKMKKDLISLMREMGL